MVEGSLDLELKDFPGQILKMKAGEMVAFPTNIKALPKNSLSILARLIKTSNLISGDMGPLPHEPLMSREVEIQNEKKKKGAGRSQHHPGTLKELPQPQGVSVVTSTMRAESTMPEISTRQSNYLIGPIGPSAQI